MLLMILLASTMKGEAQESILTQDFSLKYDTSYITVYKDELTTRIYLSRKQNGYNLSERLLNPWMNYRTNDNLLIGLGYTYSFLTFNLAVKFPFVNVDEDRYGKSSYIDLQTHTIFRSVIIDLYLQWNKGYYLANPQDVLPDYRRMATMPQRGDIRTNLMGLNVQYLFNSRRYSYKAAFVQNEFQRKSAGSPIAGAEAYWMLALSDSSTVGSNIPPSGYLDDRPFSHSDLFNAGVNGGYAYTFVWNQSLYLSLSSTFGLNLGYHHIHDPYQSTNVSMGLSAGLTNYTRVSFGFNTSNYYVGLSLVRFSMTNRLGAGQEWMGYNTGNIRFIIVKRFITKRPLKALRPDLWIL